MKRATLGLSEEHTPTSTEWFGMKVGCWHWFVFRNFWAHSAKLSCWPWTVKTFKTNHHKNQHQPANCQRAAVCHVLLFFFVSCRWGRSLQTFFLEFKFHGLLHNMYQYVILFAILVRHWKTTSCSEGASAAHLEGPLLRKTPNSCEKPCSDQCPTQYSVAVVIMAPSTTLLDCN